ncbi:hypothetical protein LG293_17140 (plasmid) [Citricoccus nitrophenolicus]
MALHGSAKSTATTVDPAEAVSVLGYTPEAGWLDPRIIFQVTYWVPLDGKPIRVSDMPAGYAANAAKKLLDRANSLIETQEEWDQDGWTPGLTGREVVRGSALYVALKDRASRPED